MANHELNWNFNEISRLASVEIMPQCTTVKEMRMLKIGLASFDKLRKLLSAKNEDTKNDNPANPETAP